MPDTFEVVTPTELRQRFNDGDFHFRSQVGELETEVEYEGHPSPVTSGEPFCTRSQILSYWDGEDQVARAHRYLCPDGSIGASGTPDPKMVLDGETVYYLAEPE